jgi:hypothetical protein
MKKIFSWQVTLGLILIALSAAVYYGHFLIFRDPHHIFIYMVGDVAFVFIEVLLVTIIIHKLLGLKEKRAMLHKLNMVIGAFFADAGTRMLGEFARIDPNVGKISGALKVTADWTEKDFVSVCEKLKDYTYEVRPSKEDIVRLKEYFEGKRALFLRLLENPNLLEHESFTDTLWAVVHLSEELSYRKDVSASPASDVEHLAGDMTRAYSRLVAEWLDYMEHLRNNYPYLFSLAIRTNPFDPEARAEVT